VWSDHTRGTGDWMILVCPQNAEGERSIAVGAPALQLSTAPRLFLPNSFHAVAASSGENVQPSLPYAESEKWANGKSGHERTFRDIDKSERTRYELWSWGGRSISEQFRLRGVDSANLCAFLPG
jgi:hypothetical protein